MTSEDRNLIAPGKPGKAALIGGWIMGGLPAAMLLMGGIMNLVKPAFVIEGTTKMGYAESVIVPLGVVLLISTVLYLIPRTAVLGAILLTGYLGGAVATHVRAGDPMGQVLFPTLFGALLWGGLCLRDLRVRSVLPIRTK